MKLASIDVENFKGLQRVAFSPGSFSCLVGENNAGKSSVLQAIVYLLSRPPQLPASQFYDVREPIRFIGHFTGVDNRHLARLAAEHREKMDAYVRDGHLTLIVEYRAEQKADIRLLKAVPVEDRLKDEAIDAALKGKKGAALRATVGEVFPEFASNLPADANLTEAKDYLRAEIAKLPKDAFVLEPAPLPTGIPTSISALLPEPIYIPAVKNLNDDLKTSQSTSFGRLLGLLLEDMTPDLASVEESLSRLNEILNRTTLDGIVVDNRHQKVRSLESDLERLLIESFPRVKIELEIPPPELKAILSSAQIYIDDGARGSIDQKGDGIKRCLTFALLRAYVQKLSTRAVENANEEVAQRPLLFLFEEPELYLHPKSQRTLFATLARIAKDYQVAVTTHSPLFFAPGVTAVFARVSKRHVVPKPESIVSVVDFGLDENKAETFRLARFENAEAGFFSSRIVLFEGESDDAYLAKVGVALSPEFDFAGRNIGMVRVGGKGNFARYRSFFDAFGIEVKVVADLDVLFEGYQHLGGSALSVELRAAAIRRVDERVAALGIRPTVSAKRIRAKTSGPGWRERYEAARAAFERVTEGNPLTDADRVGIKGLFLWEQDEARMAAVQSDEEARRALIPVLDQLRSEGICVLSLGAIEDYYPETVEASGSKPQRALDAATAVQTREQALALSRALDVGRRTELEEVFAALFSA